MSDPAISACETLAVPAHSLRTNTITGVSLFDIAGEELRLQLRPGMGFAWDVGTTTVAAALWDLSTGKCLTHGSVGNRQIPYGDNVLSRINHALENPGGMGDLQRALVDSTMLPLARSLAREAGIAMESVRESTVAGNPIMLHSLLGRPLEGFARYPFRPAFLEEMECKAGELGWPCAGTFRLLPGLGPFVGADITAGALACGLLTEEAPVMLIDFGTNGEILLKAPHEWLATATAAGPAFEGGRLRCGAVMGPGVASGVARAPGGGWHLQTLQGEDARALSGAAMVDVIALAWSGGLLNSFGRFVAGSAGVHEEVAEFGSQKTLLLRPGLSVGEADIAEIIQAKAAITAGWQTLLEEAEIAVEELRHLFVAGGFGYHLRLENARTIGLIPDIPLDRVSTVGNSSLGGASRVLLEQHTGALSPLFEKLRLVELNQTKSFSDHFTDAMAFPEVHDDRSEALFS
jgi:uncharacterized 2Fe-2S/4Fe-4S cluster protein (DUF4445 family)